MKSHMIYQVDETRDRILTEARRAFLDIGLYGVQMRDIAASCGISRASLYRYYEDKFDLALGVLESVWKELKDDWDSRKEAILAEGKTALDRISLYLTKFWLSPRYGNQLLYLAEFDAFYSGSRIPDDFIDRLHAIFNEDASGIIERLLEEGIRDGSVREGIDPRLTGVTVLNAVRGLQQRVMLRGRALIETDGREIPALATELVRIIALGLSNKNR